MEAYIVSVGLLQLIVPLYKFTCLIRTLCKLNLKIDKLNKHNYKAKNKTDNYRCLCVLLTEPYNTLSKPTCCTNYANKYKVWNS
ncbi:MAG: hypothetical protein ACLRYB_08425 [Segatella copri]